jgi:hypothetical protein
MVWASKYKDKVGNKVQKNFSLVSLAISIRFSILTCINRCLKKVFNGTFESILEAEFILHVISISS